MSYTPTTYTDATEINAGTVRTNFSDARVWLSTVVVGDISADVIDTDHIVKPDRVWGNNSYFTSGQFYANQTPNNFSYADFITDHVKQTGSIDKVMYVDIPNCGCKFTLDLASEVLVLVWAYIEGRLNTELVTQYGYANNFYLFVDGTRQDETLVHVADINGSTVTGDPGHWGSTTPRWTPFCTMWGGSLAAGEHTIQLRANPRLENCLIQNCIFIVEAYNG